jgi:chromosomal replication initiation ATPase DnaA
MSDGVSHRHCEVWVRSQARQAAPHVVMERFRGNLDQRQRLLVEQTVAQVFGVRVQDLKSASRGRAEAAFARQVAMYLDHVSCGHSLTEVGNLFERDRTTVAHACKLVEDRRDDPAFDRALELLEWAVPSLLRSRLILLDANADQCR